MQPYLGIKLDASGIEGSGTPRGKKEVTKEMTKARAINDQEKMHGSAGYIPKRNEFEYEWFNECETTIGDMEFNADVRMHPAAEVAVTVL